MQTIEQKTRTNHNEKPETTEVLLFQALQIAHNLQFPPMVRIAIEFYRSGRDMYRGRLEARDHTEGTSDGSENGDE